MDAAAERMGANWRAAEPALVRQFTTVIETINGEDGPAWREVWGPFVIGLAEQAIVQRRPLSKRQSWVATKALREAHARRCARFPGFAGR